MLRVEQYRTLSFLIVAPAPAVEQECLFDVPWHKTAPLCVCPDGLSFLAASRWGRWQDHVPLQLKFPPAPRPNMKHCTDSWNESQPKQRRVFFSGRRWTTPANSKFPNGGSVESERNTSAPQHVRFRSSNRIILTIGLQNTARKQLQLTLRPLASCAIRIVGVELTLT